MARSPLRKGQKLDQRVHEQLQAVADDPALVRSFFGHPSVALPAANICSPSVPGVLGFPKIRHKPLQVALAALKRLMRTPA